MTQFLKAAILIVSVIVTGGAAAADKAALVGFWYGIGEPGDPNIFYIDSFQADGTYNAEYRKCEKGKLIYQQTQSGTWTIKGDVLSMSANRINGKPDRFDHSYTLEQVGEREIRARLHDPDFLFVETRIPAFQFPPCYLGS
jgi:hypothetical protein